MSFKVSLCDFVSQLPYNMCGTDSLTLHYSTSSLLQYANLCVIQWNTCIYNNQRIGTFNGNIGIITCKKKGEAYTIYVMVGSGA